MNDLANDVDQKFGVLKRVDLRNLWPNEATDFTPWLAANLDILGNALGMDLELRSREAAVGPFSLDLLAHDLGSNRTVIIENQIEQTNHDHLGKLMTYAAGHDAMVAVWIAASFRDEHRQALDWLNQRTDSETEFFGVVVEAVQIDHSRPACNFRLVAFPNDWRKQTIAASTSKPSARGEAYREFFQQLIDRLRDQYNFTTARKAQASNWYSFASGISDISYGFSFASAGRARAEVYIGRAKADWNKEMFDALYQDRECIEAELGSAVEWQRLDERRASRIALYTSASIDDPTLDQDELVDWATSRLLRLKQVFGPRLSRLAQNQS